MHIKDLFDLTGKTAIITGGGRGLGEQMAEGLAEAGANIVLCSRKKEACQQVADRLARLDVKTLALTCDISQPEDIKNVVHQTIETFGRIDKL